MKSLNNNPTFLIVEDDHDQMSLIVGFALTEVKSLIDDEGTSDTQKQKLRALKILQISNSSSLKKAVSIHKNVIFALLDCNIPDTKGGPSNDQFVKTNYSITGQHKSVDIVTEKLPNTPITIISSLDRFQRIVIRYYESKHDLKINFIRKNNQLKIKENIRFYLKQYMTAIN